MGEKVRLTLQTLQVLRVLLTDPLDEHYGLEISKGSGLATGSIYPILTRLETAGWITSSWEEIDESSEGRRRRRYYRLTEDGAQYAQEAVLNALNDLAVPATYRRAPNPDWPHPKGTTA